MKNFLLNKNQIWDNTEYWKQNSEQDYVNCIQNIIKSKPFGDNKFYIYSFVKRLDDTSGRKKMYHQPRLTRPEALPGTSLMKVDPNDPSTAIIVWTLPNQENFGLYQSGKMFADSFVHECIEKFLKNRDEMAKPDRDDLPPEKIREIYIDMKNKRKAKRAKEQFNFGPFVKDK